MRDDEAEGQTERGLLARVARTDADAFEAIYARYGRAVYSLALSMLRNPQTAQEVTQEVFLGIWRGAGDFDSRRGSPRTWILALAHHKTVDAVRRQRLRMAEPLSDTAADGIDVVAEAMRRVESSRVREALMTLSPEQREAIALAYYGGYTQQEIAKRLNVPLGTVKTRMRDGMFRLRTVLQPHLMEAGP